jgi:hypothetical protein
LRCGSDAEQDAWALSSSYDWTFLPELGPRSLLRPFFFARRLTCP